MATVNAIVQNQIRKTALNGTLWSDTKKNNSLLGAAADRSLVNSAPTDRSAGNDYVKSVLGDPGSFNHQVRDYDENRQSFRSELRNRMSSLQKANDGLKNLGGGKRTEQGIENLTARQSANSSGNRTIQQGANQAAGRTTGQTGSAATLASRLAEMRQRPAEEDGEDITAGYLREEEEPREAAPPRSEAEGRLDADTRENFEAIRGFVREFNSAVSYLSEGGTVSDRFPALAASLGERGGLTDSLQQIGISVRSGGELAVDETRLAESLTEDPSTVDAALGNEGLAGQMDRRMDLASRRAEQFYPSAREALGGNSVPSVKAMYGEDSRVAANAATDVGGLYQNFG